MKKTTNTKKREVTAPKKKNTKLVAFTIFHLAEDFLKKNYDFRYNEIRNEIEYKTRPQGTWSDINENSLYLHLQKSGVRISINNLIAILKSDFIQSYNPLLNYFENLPKWKTGQRDYINAVCNYIHTPYTEAFKIQFKKWLIRAVKCAIDSSYFNKQALIIIDPKQNSGKSTFCRWLCPPLLSDYIAEDLTTDKDSRILLTKNFLINLDELSSLHKKELNSLKALFSKDKINERLPYARKNSILHRCCNFVGSTNLSEFLTDETGSVRWLCFPVNYINWDYKKDIDINKIWGQAYSLHLSGFNAGMTVQEIKENEKRNKSFQLLSAEQELISSFFTIPTENEKGNFRTATDIAQLINNYTNLHKVNKTMIGRAMISLGYEKTKDRKSDRYGYRCIFHKPTYSNPYQNET